MDRRLPHLPPATHAAPTFESPGKTSESDVPGFHAHRDRIQSATFPSQAALLMEDVSHWRGGLYRRFPSIAWLARGPGLESPTHSRQYSRERGKNRNKHSFVACHCIQVSIPPGLSPYVLAYGERCNDA